MLNQYNYAMEFLNCLKEDLIDPLKALMNDQNNTGKKMNTDIRKVEKDFRDAVEKMDKVFLIRITVKSQNKITFYIKKC